MKRSANPLFWMLGEHFILMLPCEFQVATYWISKSLLSVKRIYSAYLLFFVNYLVAAKAAVALVEVFDYLGEVFFG